MDTLESVTQKKTASRININSVYSGRKILLLLRMQHLHFKIPATRVSHSLSTMGIGLPKISDIQSIPSSGYPNILDTQTNTQSWIPEIFGYWQLSLGYPKFLGIQDWDLVWVSKMFGYWVRYPIQYPVDTQCPLKNRVRNPVYYQVM